MTRIVVYATRFCPYCMMARRLLKAKGVAFEEIRADHGTPARAEMTARSGGNTVPQIFIDDRPIGGYDELSALERAGQLDPLLQRI